MKSKLTLVMMVRSIAFWVLAAGTLPYFCIQALIVAPLPPKIRHRFMIITAGYYFCWLLRNVAGVKYTVSGLENIPQGPGILAGNHQSAWETMALNRFLPSCIWIMKKEILNIPFYGWGVRAMSTIAIDRSRGEDALSQVITQGKQRFMHGFWIIMFPEGTRVKPKSRKPFKHGCAKLAQRMNVPIVPFAHNAGYCLPKNSFWFYPGAVTVVIGKPLYPEAGEDAPALTKRLESWVYAELDKMGS